jgi:hypothetical protein
MNQLDVNQLESVLCYFHLDPGILSRSMNSPGYLANWKSAMSIDKIRRVWVVLSDYKSLASNSK